MLAVVQYIKWKTSQIKFIQKESALWTYNEYMQQRPNLKSDPERCF